MTRRITNLALIALAVVYLSRLIHRLLRGLTRRTETTLDDALLRTDEILTHPCFHRYHAEHEMLRYLQRLQGRDLSLAHSMIPLGSCTMKLNPAAAMAPVSWPGFADLLGQIMTYLAGLEARTIIWIAQGFRDAHLSAVRWLNDHIFPAEAAHVNPEMVYWSAKLAAAEMIGCGEFPRRLVAADLIGVGRAGQLAERISSAGTSAPHAVAALSSPPRAARSHSCRSLSSCSRSRASPACRPRLSPATETGHPSSGSWRSTMRSPESRRTSRNRGRDESPGVAAPGPRDRRDDQDLALGLRASLCPGGRRPRDATLAQRFHRF